MEATVLTCASPSSEPEIVPPRFAGRTPALAVLLPNAKSDEGGDPVEEVGKFGNAQVMLSVTREGYVLNDDCAFLGGIRQSRKGQHWKIDANVEWISSTREDDWLGMNGGGLPTVPPK